jgi:hypothetical protein
MNQNTISGKALEAERHTNVTFHVIVASIIFLVFAISMESLSSIIIAFLVALIVIALKRYPARTKLVAIGIYAVMLICAIALKTINNQITLRNAVAIITACEQYKTKKGVYADRLSDLVPDYLSKIPAARYAGTGGWTYYHYPKKTEGGGDYYALGYTYEFPFGRSVYHSKSKTWHSLD